MNEKAKMKRRIYELEFAIHELVLFLDSHPDSRKAMELMREYKKKLREIIDEYKEKFGDYIVTSDDAPVSDRWKWILGPWPWEIDFMEA